MAALTNSFASYEGETRRSLFREASTDSVFSALPQVPEVEVAKRSHPLLGKNGTVVHSTVPTASNSLENRSGAARECLGTKNLFEFLIVWLMVHEFYRFVFFTAYQGGKKVLGCGSNVVDHIYNVKGKLNVKLGECQAGIHKRILNHLTLIRRG